MALYLSGNREADALLSKDPLALLIGMVLDQQIPLEWAFEGPLNLTKRLGEGLDARRIAEMAPEDLAAAFAERPALHRYPASMAARVQALCHHVVAEYGGDPARIWTTAESGHELLRRVQALPGFGAQKAKIFVALLGKQLDAEPPGWVEASAPFGETGSHFSIADIDSPDSLILVREHKRALKAAAKAARPAGAPAETARPAGAPENRRSVAGGQGKKRSVATAAGATKAEAGRQARSGIAKAKDAASKPAAGKSARPAKASGRVKAQPSI